MRYFRKPILILTAALLLGLSSCAAQESVKKPGPRQGIQNKEKRVNDFQIKLSAPEKITKGDRRAKLVLEVENVSGRDIEVSYGSPRTHDFEIVDPSGKTVWCATCDKVYIQTIVTGTVAAGASESFSAVWDGTDNEGKALEPGAYAVRGSWLALEHRSELEQKIEIAE